MATKKKQSFMYLINFNFFAFGTTALLLPFLPLYLQNAGFSNVQISLLMAVGPMVSIIANPFWGFWSDRLQNIRRILIIMMLGNLIMSQIVFQIYAFIPLFILMMVFFFFQTALFPMSNSLILGAIQNTKHNFGTFRLWGSIGFAVMAVAGSPIIEWLGIHRLGFIYGAFLIITILLSLQLPRAGRTPEKFSVKDLSKVLVNPYFVAFLILSVLMSVPNMYNNNFMAIYMQQLGGTEIHVGIAWFLGAILEVPIFLLLDQYMKKRTSAMFGFLIAVSLFFILRWTLMGLATTSLQIVFVQIFHSLTFGVYFYVGTMLCTQLIPDRYRTTGQAVYAIAWMGISGMIAGVTGGSIFDWLGPSGMYFFSAGISVVGLIGFVLLRQRLNKQEKYSASGGTDVSV